MASNQQDNFRKRATTLLSRSLPLILVLLLAQSVVAFGAKPSESSSYHPCAIVDPTIASSASGKASNLTAPEVAIPARIEAPGVIPPNAAWPVLSRSVSSSVTGTGRAVTVVVEVRQAPRAASTSTAAPAPVTKVPGSILAAPLAAPIVCSYNATLSVDVHAYMGSAFSQNFSVYFDRWCIVQSCGLFGYVVTQSQMWFTRSDPLYNLSGQTLNWSMKIRDCNNTYDPRSIGNQPFIPAWFGNETQHSWYYAPMNAWPVLWSDLFEVYSSSVSQGSDVTESGYWAAHLSSSWDFPKS